MNRKTTLFAALTAVVAFASPLASYAQSQYDENEQLIAQIQADKRAVVLQAMALDDTQVTAFTPIYDQYQGERKQLMERTVALLDKYAANYDSMTDDAAKSILKDWFKLQADEDALMKKYGKKMEKVIPASKVLRFVQVENKLNTLLRLPALRGIPLAK